MDQVHRPHDMPFVTELLSVETWAKEALEAYHAISYDPHLPPDQQLAAQIGCSEDIVHELERVCNPDNLLGESLDKHLDPVECDVPTDTNLATLRIYSEEMEKRKNITYRQMAFSVMKHRRTNFNVTRQFAEDYKKHPTTSYSPKDVVLTVQLMKPYNKPLEPYQMRGGRLISLDTCFLVLGSQRLTELRDRVACLSDFTISQDFSDNPDMPQDIMAKDLYKSGFFYIHDTFYNDMREPSAEDLSQTIIDWASSDSRKGIGPFKKADMHETCFIDLSIRLGMPYLYQHQGSCQHLMVFTDVRLQHPEDCQNPDEYPITVSNQMRKRVTCCACKIYTAKWVTYDNYRLPFDPGFFCDKCFRSFNYDKDGQKIGSFKAMPYVDRHALS